MAFIGVTSMIEVWEVKFLFNFSTSTTDALQSRKRKFYIIALLLEGFIYSKKNYFLGKTLAKTTLRKRRIFVVPTIEMSIFRIHKNN